VGWREQAQAWTGVIATDRRQGPEPADVSATVPSRPQTGESIYQGTQKQTPIRIQIQTQTQSET
jgi:hypothetical protein